MTKTYSIAKSFHHNPNGRDITHGDWHGERFRTEVLVPLLNQHVKIAIDLGGLESFSPSFFEEAFGGLYRTAQISDSRKHGLQDNIIFTNIGSEYKQKTWRRVYCEIDLARERFLKENS